MEVIIGALALGGFIWLIAHFAAKSHQRWLETLDAVAARLGLTVDRGSLLKKANAAGTIDHMPLVLDTYTVSTGKSSATYTRMVLRPPWLPRDFTLKPEGLGATLGKLFLGADVQLGDTRFDEAVVVRGDEATVRALLDAETRARVQGALDAGIVVEGGEVKWVKGGVIRDAERLLAVAEQLLDLGRALDPGSVRDRLLGVVESDTSYEVALGALQIFATRWTLTREEEASLLEHRRAVVRLAVAPMVGLRAWDSVQAVLDGERVGAHDQVRAFEILWRLDGPRALALVEPRLAAAPASLATAFLEALATAERCPPLALLTPRLASADESQRPALARVLAYSAEPVEAILLNLLKDSDERVATAAAHALARQGTTAAVMPLRERAKGFLVGGDLRRAAEGAVAAIQGSLEGLGGSLSLLRDRAAEGGLSPTGRDTEKDE